MKIFFAILFSVSLTSAIWLNYSAHQKENVRNLNRLVEEQYESLCRQKQEINQVWKRGNFWIFEANRRGSK